MHTHRPHLISPVRWPIATFSFGNNRPPTIGSVTVLKTCQNTQGETFSLILDDVNIVDKSPVPLLLGYKAQAKYDLLTRPANNTIIQLTKRPGLPASVLQGQLISRHLCLPTAATAHSNKNAAWYTKQALSPFHRQFGHKQVAEVLKSFPPGLSRLPTSIL